MVNDNAGDYDAYVMLAIKLGWTKSQIDAEDAAYVEELAIALAAKADEEEAERKKQEAKGKG